ncbi:hypothetical protein F4780DRAFT_424086 [Xylariomycetidae sp. FL0641]|nr:hypothetical protein F4780DRAFT_424086 [Xylariomycetidae sp. FL0641]
MGFVALVLRLMQALSNASRSCPIPSAAAPLAVCTSPTLQHPRRASRALTSSGKMSSAANDRDLVGVVIPSPLPPELRPVLSATYV